MTILLIKTLISIIFLLLTLIAVFTMFEVLGRGEKRFNIEKLKKAHRANGIAFFFVFLVLAGLGMAYIARTGAELSPRATFHIMLAHAVLFFFLFKLAIVKVYRQFYGKVATIGIVIAFMSLGTVASSTGYYILSGGLTGGALRGPGATNKDGREPGPGAGTGMANIQKGRELFDSKCSGCHNINSDSPSGNPGLKDIMKRPALPSSGRPATMENIALQLKKPYRSMPAFPGLTQEEIDNLIDYMKGM